MENVLPSLGNVFLRTIKNKNIENTHIWVLRRKGIALVSLDNHAAWLGNVALE